MRKVISCPDRGPRALFDSQLTTPCIPLLAVMMRTIPPISIVKTMIFTWSASNKEPTTYVSTTRSTPPPKAVAGLAPPYKAIRKVPVRMPTNNEEITSLINKAITMASTGGSIDIHSGIGPATGPKTYSNDRLKDKAITTISPIHFFFIGTK